MASKLVFPALGLLLAGSIGLAAHQAKSAALAPIAVRFTVPSLCTVGPGPDRPAVSCSRDTPWHAQRPMGEQYWTVMF